MGTHKSQRKLDEVAGEASNYKVVMRILVNGPHRNPHFILNMDQTPVYFTMSTKRTLEMVRVKTVHVYMLTNNTRRATVAVTFMALGLVLPSMVVFKGKPNGHIAKTEFGNYPATHQNRCQENAWMDEAVMIAWVNDVLKLYVTNAPKDIIPLLIL
jgi:hypothetical protein